MFVDARALLVSGVYALTKTGCVVEKRKGLPIEKAPLAGPVVVKKMTDAIHHFGGSRSL